MKKLPDLPCADCGKPAGRTSGDLRRKICFECALTRARVAAMEMANHTGSAYAKWQKSAGPRGRPRLDSR